MEDEYLDAHIIREIVLDAVKLCPDIKSVALVGSFARGEPRHDSDVDLLLDIDSEKYSLALKTFGKYVDEVLDNQFNRRLDIINYEQARKRASGMVNTDHEWYFVEGYREMFNQAIWLYRKNES